MPSWHGRSKGTRPGYRIFVFLLRTAGVKAAYFLLRFVALYYFLFSIKSSRSIYSFFRKRLGFSGIKSLIKIYSNYYQFGQSLIDKVVIMAGIKNSFTFNFDGEENLKQIIADGKGGILISAHIGNWEAAGNMLGRLSTKINIVMYDGEHQKIKEYLEEVTGKRNVNVIVVKNDLTHIYEISEALGNNELICMHADRYLPGVRTEEINFLGEPAPFPIGPFVLATKFKVPVSFVFAMKESKLHYHLFASPGKVYDNASRHQGMKEMISGFASEMENKVRKYPEQWYNYYDFWKKENEPVGK